ncbi:uncharacterized protein V6R79_025308 [Siganus canaliculatus]
MSRANHVLIAGAFKGTRLAQSAAKHFEMQRPEILVSRRKQLMNAASLNLKSWMLKCREYSIGERFRNMNDRERYFMCNVEREMKVVILSLQQNTGVYKKMIRCAENYKNEWSFSHVA